MNELNYYKTGSAQSKQVKQPIKLLFLINLGKLFLSLAQLSPNLFSILSRILTFRFNLGVVFDFWGPYWDNLWVLVCFINWFGSTHVVEQLLFFIFSSVLTFDFDLLLRSFFTFWDHNGLFWGIWYLNNIYFL